MARNDAADVVIVGGGIAGSALALALARRGVGVTVLERQTEYADRVRGEYTHPWGVAEATRLEVLDLLVDAGGVFPHRFIPYDEIMPPHIAEVAASDTGSFLPGFYPLCVGHPAACRALSSAAESAGARYVRGIGDVQVTPGRRPSVTYENAGQSYQQDCRLIVGADGRTSVVRAAAGIPLHRAEPENLVSGMLVDGVTAWPQDALAIGTEGDREYLVFPQGGSKTRLYTCTALDQRNRYTGPNGPTRFLEDFGSLTCLPQAASIAAATPIGPCATLSGEDTWVEVPAADGVVLIGDAAGYNNPNIGEGTSIALRDARMVADVLLNESDWSSARFAPYADERRERMRRLRFTASLNAALYTTFGPEGAARRGRFFGRLQDPTFRGGLLFAAQTVGPENLPDFAFTDEFRAEVLQ